jgi:flagellar capping protein FliD
MNGEPTNKELMEKLEELERKIESFQSDSEIISQRIYGKLNLIEELLKKINK